MTNPKTPRRMARPAFQPAGSNDACSEHPRSPILEPTEKRVTKRAQVIALLCSDGGASLSAIVEATGWQAHTARAALTGLRKKSFAVERFSIDGETRYRIVEVVSV